jgi:serine/threonine-protein kinase
MGVVYRARRSDADTDADAADVDVALKVLPANEDASDEQVTRFQREARIAGGLDHPGIVRCLEWGEADGVAWFAMELIEGEPLSKQIRDQEFTWQEAVTLTRDVADALAVAHEAGVLHRDIKPSNILIDADGRPHLADFGLAKELHTASKLTRTGATLGTPAYMSPEQARGEIRTLTPASDVRSLGAVLYELLAGQPAFTGDTPAAVIGHVIQGTPTPLPGLPPAVRDLIAASLANSPADRPRDAAALRNACERVLAGRRPGVRARRRRVALAAVAAAAVVAALAGGWWLSRPAPKKNARRCGLSATSPNALANSWMQR